MGQFSIIMPERSSFSMVDRKLLGNGDQATDRGDMEDPHSAARRALYARIGTLVPDDDPEDSRAGLFTRPALLALRDEETAGFPVRSLNRACRVMLVAGGTISVEDIARQCGFEDLKEFDRLFGKATGWTPEAWIRRFSRRSPDVPQEA